MTGSEFHDTAAYRLTGTQLDDGWRVEERVDFPADHTGSAFSVGYRACHASGVTGFLKAFDYAAALDEHDPARELERLTATYNAERNLLDWCGQHSLNRIVRVLGAGATRVEGLSPAVVNYLIFELADGDARAIIAAADPADLVPRIRLAHNAAVAMTQLHGIGIAHQDIKPSNLLVWTSSPELSGKLGDLGCAYVESRPAPHDHKIVAGDCSYASPERLYKSSPHLGSARNRQAADMFMVGNLLVFLMVGGTYNGILNLYLDRSQHWT